MRSDHGPGCRAQLAHGHTARTYNPPGSKQADLHFKERAFQGEGNHSNEQGAAGRAARALEPTAPHFEQHAASSGLGRQDGLHLVVHAVALGARACRLEKSNRLTAQAARRAAAGGDGRGKSRPPWTHTMAAPGRTTGLQAGAGALAQLRLGMPPVRPRLGHRGRCCALQLQQSGLQRGLAHGCCPRGRRWPGASRRAGAAAWRGLAVCAAQRRPGRGWGAGGAGHSDGCWRRRPSSNGGQRGQRGSRSAVPLCFCLQRPCLISIPFRAAAS